MILSRTIFLLAIILDALVISSVSAMELSDKALSKIEPQVLEQFIYSDERELIFLFKDTAIAEEVRLQKAERGLSIDDWEILRTKKNAYRYTKKAVLKDFDQDEIQQLYSYDQLPMMFARVTTLEILSRLLENDHIVQVFENSKHTLSLEESLPLIGQQESYAAGHTGQGTTVAVLDSGADYRKAAFGSCVEPGVPENCKVIVAKDFTSNDDGVPDAHGHGTNVSAIVLGVAPDTRIAALDVFVGSGLYTADVIAAIDWVIANQAIYNIVAMNLSFGLGLYDEICVNNWATKPFANARAVGVAPVAASGNNAEEARMLGPACAPGAVRVGAVYDTNLGRQNWRWCADDFSEADMVPCYSNSSSYLDLLAPGTMVTAGELTMSGTSMATAHVSGAFAVLKGESAFQWDNVNSITQRLKNSGKQIFDDRNGLMFPRIDLHAALAWLKPDQVTGISASDGTFSGRVRISFNPVDGAMVYRVFRCLDMGDTCGLPIGYPKTGTFDDRKADPGTVYYYRVRACTTSVCGSVSDADSGFARFTPAMPAGIRATDGTFSDRVRISFNPVDGAMVYRVFRCLDMGDTCGLPIGYPKTGTFDDRKADPGTVYYYRVRACTTSVCGSVSEADSGFSRFTPARPTGIRATDGTFSDRVRISFNPVDGAMVYRVFRCLDMGDTCGLPIGYPKTGTFDDTRGDFGTVYFYRVKACTSQLCGKFSVANTGYRGSTPSISKR